MAYEVGDIASSDQITAKTVALGGNYRVYVNKDNARLIGTFRSKADVEAAYTPATHGSLVQDSSYPTPNVGFGLDDIVAVVLSNSVESGGSNKPKLTTAYTNESDAIIADYRGTVEFDLPEIAEYQDIVEFQKGYARDVVFKNDAGDADAVAGTIDGSTDAKTAKSLGLIASTGAQYFKKGGEVGIYKMPDIADFNLITQTDSFAHPSTQSKPISVPAGLNSSRWVVNGMSVEPEITFTQKFLSNTEIIQRLAGQHVTLMVEIYKNDAVLSDRIIFTESILHWGNDSGEGESPVMRNVTARFKEAFYFYSDPS